MNKDTGIEVKSYKLKTLPTTPIPNAVLYVKADESSEVINYITDINGIPFPLKDEEGSVVADATTTEKGILKLAGDLGGTADLPTTPTAIHKNGDEVKDGSLTLNDTLYLPNFTAVVGEFVNIGVDEFGAVINIPIETTTAGNVEIAVVNKTGFSISKGTAVYISGAQGSRATIDLALGDANLTTSSVIGLTNETIADNAIGYVVILGEIDKLDTSLFTNGDRVYVSPTVAGGLTNIVPVSPNNAMFVGTVTNSHATQGKIVINIVYATKLDRLIDVAIVSPTDRQLLTYETSSGLWKNSSLTLADITTTLGYTPVSEITTLNINGVSQDLSTNREWRTAQADTGVLTFTGSTTNSATTINTGAVKGYIVDNETDPLNPTYTYIDYPGEINKTVTTLGSGTESFVLLGSDGLGGGTITFQNTFPTSAQRKAKIWISKISHPSGTVVVVINEPDYITSPMAFSRDMFQRFAYINDSVYPYANGANLNINITGGSIGGNGINFVNDRTRPNDITVLPGVAQAFVYRTQLGGATGAVTAISPGFYDVGGVVTPVGGGANSSTLQYIYIIPGQGYIIQYGQTVYSTLSNAIIAVGREPLIIYPNLVKNSLLIGVLAINKSATQLDNISQAQFFKADIFGQIIGATSGTTVGTLQTAYNNSLVPQIVTTAGLGALTVKQGSGLDTDNILVGQNGTGVNTFSVDGNGLAKSGVVTLDSNPAVANNDLVRKDYLETRIPVNYSKIVYVNDINPNSATIFDLNNPPTVNDNTLKIDVNNLYVGIDASTWVYITSPAGYITKTLTSGTSNFYLGGTVIDAGGTKTSAIERTGTVGGAMATASNHFVTKAQHDTKGDMTTNTTQTVSGVKTFLAGMFGLRNTANTFTSFFASAVTASRTWTWPDKSGTVAMTSDIVSQLTGTVNRLVKFGTTTTGIDSRITDDGTFIGIGTVAPATKDITFNNLSSKVLGVEESNNITQGRSLEIAAGRTVDFSSLLFTPLGQTVRNWASIAISSTGNVYAGVATGDIYKQTSGTGNFISLGQTSRQWSVMAAHHNGDMYAAESGRAQNTGAVGDIYKQTGGVGNFVALGQVSRKWAGIAVYPNGDIYACSGGTTVADDIYKQTGGAGSFVALGQTARQWNGITVHPSGDVYACVYNGDIYKQTGGTGNFVALGLTVRAWMSISASPNGDIYACTSTNIGAVGSIYKQTGGAGPFVDLGQTQRRWVSIYAVSSIVYACDYGGDIYTATIGVGAPDINGGTLYLKAGTGKGIGQSRVQIITGQKTVSGTDMHIETVRAEYDENGNYKRIGTPVYADNTAALAGGLTAGMEYRTATGIKMEVY